MPENYAVIGKSEGLKSVLADPQCCEVIAVGIAASVSGAEMGTVLVSADGHEWTKAASASELSTKMAAVLAENVGEIEERSIAAVYRAGRLIRSAVKIAGAKPDATAELELRKQGIVLLPLNTDVVASDSNEE